MNQQADHPFLEHYHLRLRGLVYAHRTSVEQWRSLIQKQTLFIRRHQRFRTPVQLTEIYLGCIACCQVTGDLSLAQHYVARLLGYADLPARLRLAVYAAAFEVYLRAADYRKAGTMLQSAASVDLRSLTPLQQSQWYLKEAYLYYLLRHQHQTETIAAYTPTFASGFRLSDFDQRTLPLASDKSGYQVQVLIIRTLLLHQSLSTDWAHHAKILANFYQRHLVQLADEKTRLFFQLITQTATAGFNGPAELPRVKSLVQALAATPDHFEERQELISYQTLWKMITAE